MQVGETVLIKNQAGVLNVHIVKELDLEDVTKGIGDDRVQTINRPRLEYHRGGYGEHLITLCGDLDSVPFNMYLLYVRDYDEKPTCYLGVCNDAEDSVFETVYSIADNANTVADLCAELKSTIKHSLLELLKECED